MNCMHLKLMNKFKLIDVIGVNLALNYSKISHHVNFQNNRTIFLMTYSFLS